ncbi:MAG: hypothetical protein ACI9GW_000620 [Halieaceae bacterium]|jgi:hypothetical protein
MHDIANCGEMAAREEDWTQLAIGDSLQTNIIDTREGVSR